VQRKITGAAIVMTLVLACSACGGRGATSVSSQQTNSSASTTAPSGDLHFKAPDGWVVEQPSSKMRAAQYKLPKTEGDGEDASLVLYYFGPSQGGPPQANIDRWITQIQQADGSSSKDKAKTDTMTVNSLKITTVDVTGTYMAEMAPGSSTTHNYRLRAAVIETPKGNYFLKLVGPAKTVGRWEQSYTDYLTSFEFK